MSALAESLKCTITKDLKKDAYRRKIFNIEAFSELDRTNLVFQSKERRINVHKTKKGEQIFIQFPGKEAAREGDKSRPWDFRPKIINANGVLLEDLSFKDIWNDLTDLSEKGNDALPILAAVLTRMAYMIDHKIVDESYSSGIIDFDSGNDEKSDDTHIKWFKYVPSDEIIEYLQKNIGDIHGMSIEAYLVMNDLLAQNEDCKYFYRDVKVNGKNKWGGDIGRKNNLLTHVAIIGFLQKIIRFTEITDHFQRMRGVSPIPDKYISKTTNGLIEIKK